MALDEGYGRPTVPRRQPRRRRSPGPPDPINEALRSRPVRGEPRERKALPGEFYRNADAMKVPLDRRALAFMEEVWKASKGLYPGATTMPKTRFPTRTDDSPGYAWVSHGPQGRRKVMWPLDVTERLLDKGGPDNVALSTLLHEWAHVYQNPELERGYENEGGAEAFTRLMYPQVAKQFGGAPMRYYGGAGYGDWTRRILRKKDRDWVLRGQFD